MSELTLGWIGTGRMGFELCRRLLSAGCNLTVYNRTLDKATPLADLGASLADTPAKLADRDIVFSIVSDPDALLDVTVGSEGLFSAPGVAPRILVDSSTVSSEVSERVRKEAVKHGTELVAAPVSGNPNVVAAGKLTVVVSGPRGAYEIAKPYLDMFGTGVAYVGEGDAARLVKICHNLLLGVVTQSLAETLVLAERAGVSRKDFLDFINMSVMGCTFSRYKTPAFVKLDFKPSFTAHLLRKDFELGLEEGRKLGVPLPAAALVHQLIVSLIGQGHGDVDFAALLKQAAAGAGLDLEPEPGPVADGLGRTYT